MATPNKPNDLKHINTFEKELKSKAGCEEGTGTNPMSMSSFARDIDAIVRGRYLKHPWSQ